MEAGARRMFTVAEAAAVLGIGRSTAYELVVTGELDAVRVGRRWLVRPSTLEAILGEPPPSPDEVARTVIAPRLREAVNRPNDGS